MKKETETVDVVKEKPKSDSVQIVVKEEQVHQTVINDNKRTTESNKESPVVVMEEVTDAENSEESSEKVKDEKGEEKDGEQVLQCVQEVNVEAVDEEKDTVEDITEKDKEEKCVETAEKEDVKIVDEIKGKHEDEIRAVEDVSAHVEFETTEIKVFKGESSEANESASELEVKAEEKSERKEEVEVEFQVKLEEITADTKFHDEVVLISQDLDSEPKNEFIEKDVVKKDIKEAESIKEDTELAEKVAEALKTEPEVKEICKAKQEADIGANDVGVKPKHSSKIISKVKESFIKAKKAIIGKSPSSKTISTEAEEEIKVK